MTLREKIAAAVQQGDHRQAFRLAMTLRDADLLGWGPDIRPLFQRQLGRDPLTLIKTGIAALEAFLRGEHK